MGQAKKEYEGNPPPNPSNPPSGPQAGPGPQPGSGGTSDPATAALIQCMQNMGYTAAQIAEMIKNKP